MDVTPRRGACEHGTLRGEWLVVSGQWLVAKARKGENAKGERTTRSLCLRDFVVSLGPTTISRNVVRASTAPYVESGWWLVARAFTLPSPKGQGGFPSGYVGGAARRVGLDDGGVALVVMVGALRHHCTDLLDAVVALLPGFRLVRPAAEPAFGAAAGRRRRGSDRGPGAAAGHGARRGDLPDPATGRDPGVSGTR